MLEEIKRDLGAYYSEEDEEILATILDDVTTNALSFSNNSVENLRSEIKECVKISYLRRGTEHNQSLNASGESTTYIDAMQQMRDNIVKNGKRRIY